LADQKLGGVSNVIARILQRCLTDKDIAALSCLIISLISLSSTARAQQSTDDCESILKAHGFLSRAQFQCGFRDYSEEMMQSAARCSRGLKEADAKSLLRSGMSLFDRNEREKGHDALCKEILAKFPGMVRN
jgi:hypothetical protein